MLRRILYGAAGVVAAIAAAVLGLGCCAFSAPRYAGARSDHFDGERFVNQVPLDRQRFAKVWQWLLTRDPPAWRVWDDAQPGPPPPRRVGDGVIRVTFVNHATTLVQLDGVNVLTDPIWSERTSPVGFVGPKRVRPPGIRFEDLPPIDAVVVSHNHYDHLDLPTLKRLQRAFGPRIFAGLGNAQLFEREEIAGASDLDWWQSVQLPNGVKLTAVPVQHFSGRGICDRAGTLWAGYVLEGKGGAVYFAGDTADGPHFAQVRERFGAPAVSILPIGAFLPRWLMAPVHIGPEEAVKAHQILGSRYSVPMHFGTFQQGDEGEDEPVERLRAALARERIPADRFRVLGFGEALEIAPDRAPTD